MLGDGELSWQGVAGGIVGGIEIGDLTFTIWDAAVPALPVGGVLLLGALLLWRGAVRARAARGVVAGDRACGAG